MTLYAGKASASSGKKRGRAVPALATLLIVMTFLLLQSIAPEVALAASSWKDIPGPDNGDATALAYDSVHNMLYRGTGSRGVFRYNGTAWTDTGGAISGYQITSLAYDPTRNVLYAGCFDPQTYTGKGVWACSTPNTAPSWSDTGGGVSSYQITALAYDDVRNLLYAGCYDTSDNTGHGVWACSTPDTAPSWSDTGGGVSSYQITALAYDDVRNLLYAGCYDTSDYTGHGVWACSTPNTSPSWSDTGGGVSGNYIGSLACDPGNDVLYAATDSNQVWACASPDTAPTWSNTSGTIFTYAARSLAYDSNHNVLYAGMDAIGVWACATPNTTPVWNDTGGGVSRLTVKAMAYDSLHQILYAGMQYDGVWACNTTDEAPTWSRDLAFPAYPVLSLYYDSTHNVLYAGTGNNGIWACANPDTAPSWTNTGGGAGIYMVPSLAYDSINNVLYAATVGGGVWACAAPNTAPVWTGIGMSVGSWHGDIDSLAYDPVHNLLYTGVYGFGVWVCANPNTTPAWADTGGISIYSLPSLYYDSVHNVLYAGTWGGYGVFACATPDTTPVWTNTGGGVSGYSIFSLAYDAGSNVLYAGTEYQGVWECATPDTAPNWTTLDGRVSNYHIDSLAYDAGHNVLYAGTDYQGAWYYSADTTPTVTTTAVSNITDTTASSGGNVTDDGTASVTARGVCWSTSTDPTITDSHTTNGTGTGTFTSSITGLSPGTLYHVRAYATNSVGTSYGDDLTFTTLNPPPTTPTAWYLAEGTNAWGFSTYITIENPNDSAVNARLTYMDPNPQSGAGVVGTRDVALPPLSQTTVSSMSDIGTVDFSTKVECLEGKQIAVDRTMFWTGEGAPSPEGHSSVGTTTPSETWYLPEGSSAWGFETWTLLFNPNAADAHLRLTYMTEGGTPKVFDRTVPAHCRASYNMAADIGAQDASIRVTSDAPVVAERSMYRNNRREGSCSIGAPAPASDFFLAEGATGYDAGFSTWVLVQNPNDSEAEVTLTYQTQTGPKPQGPFTMGANTRKTIRVNDALPPNTDVSTAVHGSKPIIAERAVYWGADTPLGEAMHASIGLDSAHMSFYLPDGQTDKGFETWTLVANPNPGSVTVRITYLPQGGGTPVSFTDEIPPGTRSTYSMADKGINGRASIKVESLDGARPVIVERAMYWNSRGAGTDTIGGFSD